MLTLLGSLLGFGTSFLPKVMDYFQDKSDKIHELQIMRAQAEIELDKTAIEANIREIEAVHKEHASVVRKASQFFINLSSSVRPIVTYLFVIEWCIITYAIAFLLIRQDGVTIDALRQILDEDFMAIFAAIISFWFGDRRFGRNANK